MPRLIALIMAFKNALKYVRLRSIDTTSAGRMAIKFFLLSFNCNFKIFPRWKLMQIKNAILGAWAFRIAFLRLVDIYELIKKSLSKLFNPRRTYPMKKLKSWIRKKSFRQNGSLETSAEKPCPSGRKNKKSFYGSCDCIGSPLELALAVNLFLAVYQSNHFNFTRRLKTKLITGNLVENGKRKIKNVHLRISKENIGQNGWYKKGFKKVRSSLICRYSNQAKRRLVSATRAS